MNSKTIAAPALGRQSLLQRMKRELVMNKYLYIMAIPIVAYFVIFHYMPLYGAIIAFKDYDVGKGIWGSAWVGFKHFKTFFTGMYFGRLLKNTLIINFYMLIFEFPAPILLALMLNELRSRKFKSVVQTVSYLPHFISMVVICGMIVDFCSREGVVTNILVMLGMERTNILVDPKYFRAIYVISGIWQQVGWGSILYLSALSGIDAELYEAASIDGAGRFQKLLHITLPSLVPIIMVLFIMRIGQVMNVGFEKIILIYNQNTMEVADVISTYVYRKGLLEGTEYSYTTAVGLFNSVLNFILLVSANFASKKLTKNSLW